MTMSILNCKGGPTGAGEKEERKRRERKREKEREKEREGEGEKEQLAIGSTNFHTMTKCCM